MQQQIKDLFDDPTGLDELLEPPPQNPVEKKSQVCVNFKFFFSKY